MPGRITKLTKGLFRQDYIFFRIRKAERVKLAPNMRASSSHGVRAVSELEPSGVAAYSTLRSVLPCVLSHTQTDFALHLYSREPWIPFLLNTSSFLSQCSYTVKLKYSCFNFPLQWGPAGTKVNCEIFTAAPKLYQHQCSTQLCKDILYPHCSLSF